jgi:hypothetical protein
VPIQKFPVLKARGKTNTLYSDLSIPDEFSSDHVFDELVPAR